MTLLLPVVAALSAILILPGWSFFYEVAPKALVILVGAGLVFVLPQRRPAKLSKPLRYFTIIAALQAVIILLTTLTSTHRQLSILGSTWRRDGAIAEIAVLVLAVAGAFHFASDGSARRVFLRITVFASIPLSIYGVLQYFGIDPLLPAAGYHFGEGVHQIVRPPATLGHAAYFATYLLYAAFGGLALSSDARQNEARLRIAALAASTSAIFAIVLSGTRAALLGLIIGAMFVALRERLNWRFMAVAAALIVVVAGFYISPAGERLRARVFWSSEDPYGGSRLLLWRDSLRMSTGHLLTGYGPETFAVEFPRHQSIELARQFPDFYSESAHNIFLDALTAKGMFGFATLAALVILVLVYARGQMGGAFVAMLVAQQFTTFTPPTELYFYLAAAIILSDVQIHPDPETPPRRWMAIFAIPFLIPFLGMAIYLGTGDALLAAGRRALDGGDFDSAWQLQERARAWRTTFDIYFSRRYYTQPDTLANTRRWQYAMASASRASQTSEDRQNALTNLAALESPAGDAAAVEWTLREAVAAAPMWYKSHWLLAQVLALEERRDEARAEAQMAMDCGGGKHPEVRNTLETLR